MRRFATPVLLAILLVTATFVSMPIYEQEAYPLPPETETFTLNAQKDSFVRQGSEKENEGANIILDLQSSDKRRPVIAFDQGQIAGLVSDSSLVRSAVLKFYVTDNGNNWGPTGNTIGAHRLLSAWEEGNGWNLGNSISGTGSGVTWACGIDTDISNNLNDCSIQWNGGSFASATSEFLVTNSVVNQWIEFNVTSDVRDFVDGAANNGWIIKKTSESLNGDMILASSEASANNPVLEITVFRPEVALANEYLNLVNALDEVGRSLDGTQITQQLVDDINSDLARLKEVVIELQNLGFDGEIITARTAGQVVGTVTFRDKDTSELFFETAIPDGTLGIFAVVGLNQEFTDKGTAISFDQYASLLRSSMGLVQAITNYEDDEIASNFVLASILAFHPSTGNTILPLIVILIYIAIIVCLDTPCADAVAQLIEQEAAKAFEFMYPLVTVSGMKFEDKNGNGEREPSLGEGGLGGWEFTLTSVHESEILFTPLHRTTNSTGHFVFFQVNVPRFSDRVVIIETQKEGWEATTEGGELQDPAFVPPTFDPTPNSPPGVTKIENITFGNRLIPPTIIFEENFDSGISGWSQTLCQRGSGQQCFITTRTDPTPVPSAPNWGASGLVDTVPGCGSSVASRHSKTFTVPASGNYQINAVMFGSTCSGCTVTARLFVDNQQIFAKPGQRIGFTPPQPPASFSTAIPLTAGQHSIQIGMTSTLACSGTFQGEFDNISIAQVSTIQSQSQSSQLPGGPYYWIELNQTSVNATAPDTATVRLNVHWDLGYEPEPVLIDVVSNSTFAGISHTVTSAYNTTTYQAFDITFVISPEVEVGQYQYLIFVNEEDSDNSLAEVIQLSIQ